MKYKVIFKGFSYVEAESEEEAVEKYFDEFCYMEYQPLEVTEVDTFDIYI